MTMKKKSVAQKRIERVKDEITTDHKAGASIRFLSKKYEICDVVIRRNLIEWGLMSPDKDTSKMNNPNPTFGRDKKDTK